MRDSAQPPLAPRDAEQGRAERWLRRVDQRAACLYVHGLPGAGKTTFLRALEAAVRKAGFVVEWLPIGLVDREVVPLALRRALQQRRRTAIFVDDWHELAGGEAWLAGELARARGQVLVILGSRTRPGAQLQQSGLLPDRLLEIELGPLEQESALHWLASLGVESGVATELYSRTRGLPLLLALGANHAPEGKFELAPGADRTRAIVESFFRGVARPEHAAALEVASILRCTDQADIECALALPEGHGGVLFSWLRSLSVTRAGPYGLHMHDLVAEILSADVVWRDPSRVRTYVERLLPMLMQTLGSAEHSRARTIERLVSIVARAPNAPDTFRAGSSNLDVGVASEAERAEGLALFAAQHGASLARILAGYIEREPLDAIVLRDAGGAVEGFMVMTSFRDLDLPLTLGDEALRMAMTSLAQAGHWTPGELFTAVRITVRHTGDAPSNGFARLALAMTPRNMARRETNINVVLFSNIRPWLSELARIDYSVVPGKDIQAAFVRVPQEPGRALEQIARRLWGTSVPCFPMAPPDDGELRAGVVEALRHLRDPIGLSGSSLAASLFGSVPINERGLALQRWLRDGIRRTADLPRGETVTQALRASFEGDRSNAEAAAIAHMSESTLKRHRRAGIEHLVARARAELTRKRAQRAGSTAPT